MNGAWLLHQVPLEWDPSFMDDLLSTWAGDGTSPHLNGVRTYLIELL